MPLSNKKQLLAKNQKEFGNQVNLSLGTGDEIYKMKKKKAKILLAALLLAVGETAFADGKAVSGIRQINPTTVEITYSDGGV